MRVAHVRAPCRGSGRRAASGLSHFFLFSPRLPPLPLPCLTTSRQRTFWAARGNDATTMTKATALAFLVMLAVTRVSGGGGQGGKWDDAARPVPPSLPAPARV